MPLILKGLTDRHIWKKKQKQKPALFLSKQCWFPRYKVPVLSTCGGCHPEGFIVASFYDFKYIVNNHDNNYNNNSNNNNNNNTNNDKLGSCINFYLHNFYFPVSILLCQFSFFAT